MMALKSSSDKKIYEQDNPNESNELQQTSKLKTQKKSSSLKKKHCKRKIDLSLNHAPVTVPTEGPYDAYTNFIASMTGPMYPTISPYFPQYNYPVTHYNWNPILPVQSPLYTFQPLPILVNPTQIISTPVCTYIPPTVPIVSPIITQAVSSDIPPVFNNYEPANCCNEIVETTEAITEPNNDTEYNNDNNESAAEIDTNRDPLKSYLSLPKELFLPARLMQIDPNPIVDEFCKMKNLQCHMSWILDLEFGVPRSPITRPIPFYNVKFNSIHCKNTPEAIHPGFESCTADFKRALLYYYDTVISSWYRGYVIMNYDKSVENFQSWLLLPMQALGMCWP